MKNRKQPLKTPVGSIFSGRKVMIRGVLGIFLLLLMLSAQAHTYAQPGRLSLTMKNASLKEIFKEIERQSEFYFMYNATQIDVSQRADVRIQEQTIQKVLNKLLHNTGIQYEMLGKQIVLTPAPVKLKGNAIQQAQIKLTGTVTDKQGNTLPGVNVTIKGTTQGTVTNIDGKYTIEVPSEETVLHFSFVGFEDQEILVGNQTVIDVVMAEKATQLDEIVVVGYGTSSKRLLTSSIASIDEQAIEGNISSGIQEVLQGRTSGVQINSNSGTPGAAISVNIRGVSSISAGSQPLYVVDGIPITTGNFGQISMEGQGIDAVADINPNNIKSISILKDASAAAIYGARAGNGVILIETKTGSMGDTKIDFKTYVGMQEVYKKLDLLNAEEFVDYISQTDPQFAEGVDPTIDTDWQDEVMRQAPIQNYELSVSGGKERTRFFVSGRYFDQQGVLLGTDYQKFNGRVNLDHNLNDFISMGARMSVNYSINNRVRGDQSINGVLPNAVSKPPVYAVRDQYGNYLQEGFWDNPVAIGNEVTNVANAFRNLSNVFAEVKLLPELRFKHQWGIDIYNLRERRFEPSVVKSAAETNGYAEDASSEVLKVTQQSTLNYITSINENHSFNVLLGYSFESIDERYNAITATDFPSDELTYIESAGNIESASASAYEAGLQSFFGRVKYNFDNTYILDVSLRRDGSSNFGENNKYALLPAAAFAWRLSEEGLFKQIAVLNELKFKISYGLTGNDNIGAFGSLNLYSTGYNYYGRPGIIPTQIPNPDLKWETTHNYNTGLDIALFSERIYLTSDFYYNKTTDLLLNRPLPGSSGFTSMKANVGALENKGMEFSLNTVNLKSPNFEWNSSLNLSFNRNEVLELYEDQPITGEGRGNNAAIVGEPLGIFYMYHSLGVDPSTGELVFEDLNDDGNINDADRMVVGDPNPDFTGGFTNRFRYKHFDLSIFLQFVYGNDVFNGVRQYTENMSYGTNDNQLATIKDRWRAPGDQTYIPKVNGEYNLEPSSHYIEDGSYLRIKDITLGYDFPEALLNRMGFINSARIYVKVQNLFTLTPYSGMDPEVNYSGVGTLRQGTDFFTYPQVRTFSVGLNMNL